ncbi:protein FREE1-like [Carex rostrata]
MLDPSTGRSTAKEAGNKPTVQSHENLARKLQEELERNRKSTSGSKSNGSGGLLREVACPVCTVHLHVRNTYKYYLPFVTSLGWFIEFVYYVYRIS